MGDLNDVYAWMNTDASKINLAMTVSPFDDTTRAFGPSVLYVFHISKREITPPPIASPGAGENKVICKFTSDTDGECWAVNGSQVVDYVQGDFSATAGKASASGKLKVFAGRRSDPFFFNLSGFKRAIGQVVAACGGTECPGGALGSAVLDAAGCPPVDGATAGALVGLIGATCGSPATCGTCPQGEIDCFINANIMAIVVQVDKTHFLASTDRLVSVWASTHAAP